MRNQRSYRFAVDGEFLLIRTHLTCLLLCAQTVSLEPVTCAAEAVVARGGACSILR
jgi:hypothetical protein